MPFRWAEFLRTSYWRAYNLHRWEDAMSLFMSLFGIFIENLCTFLLLKSFQGRPKIPDWLDVIFFLPGFIMAPLPDSYGTFALIYGQAVTFFYCHFRSNRKLIPAIFLLCPTTVFLQFIQGMVILLLTPVMKILPIAYLPLIGSITTLFLILLIVFLTPCASLYHRILTGGFALKFLVLNTYLGIILKTLFYKIHMTDIYEFVNLMFASLFLMLSVNICIFYYENKLKEKQRALLVYEKNKPLMETLIGDIRSSQHEYTNRLQSIAALVNVCHDYDSLRESLVKYAKKYNTVHKCYPLLTLNMPLVTSTLYNLTSMAEKKGITILYDIPSPELTCRISEHIIVDFLRILTQNAIEATSTGESIYITLTNQKEVFYFEVQNPTDHYILQDEFEQFFQKGYSTKTNESHPKPELSIPHGYGLSELLSQVNKLGGTVSADCIFHEEKNWAVFSLTL